MFDQSTRQVTGKRIADTTSVFAAAAFITLLTLFIIRASFVGEAHQDINQNHLVKMIAGTEPLEDTDLGHFAQTLRQLTSSDAPVYALTDYHIYPGQFDEAASQINVEVFPEDTTDIFADSFVLFVLKASSPAQMSRVLVLPDTPDSLGWRAWWSPLVGASLVVILGLLAAAAYGIGCKLHDRRARRSQRNTEQQAAADELAALPASYRDAAVILAELERRPKQTPEVLTLIGRAKAIIAHAKVGAGVGPLSSYDLNGDGNDLDDFRNRLDELAAGLKAQTEFIEAET